MVNSARETLLDIRGVTKKFGTRNAVNALDLQVRAGDVCGFVGANGAGKTTALRVLSGLMAADAGTGHVLNFDLRTQAQDIRREVGYMPQRITLYRDLSVQENLGFRGELYDINDCIDALMIEFNLETYRHTPVAALSEGWARRVQLAATLLHRPRLLLLDEPTAGLDVGTREFVWQRVAEAAQAGAGVVINTHDLAEAERCTRIVFFQQGRVRYAGTPQALIEDAALCVLQVDATDLRTLPLCSLQAAPRALTAYGNATQIIVDASSCEAILMQLTTAGQRVQIVPTRLEHVVLAWSVPMQQMQTL